MEWRIGQVPQRVWKDVRMSAQDRRNAQVATYINERAEEQRKLAQQMPQASQDKQRRHISRQKPPDDVIKEPLSQTGELRLSLLRKLTAILHHCHECPARACRRHRRCASPALECAKLAARRSRSPEREQAALAQFQRALARRRVEMNREEQT